MTMGQINIKARLINQSTQ